MSSYKPIRTFTYAKPVKYGAKGAVNYFNYRGKKVRTYLDPSGRKLRILDAPPDVISAITRAEKVVPYKDRLHVRFPKQKKKQPQAHKPKPPAPAPAQKEKEEKPVPAKPKPKEEEPEVIKLEIKKPAPAPPKSPTEYVAPRPLTEEERQAAMRVPVPDEGVIPTPYIDKSKIPSYCWVKGVEYYDHPSPGAPKGMLKALRGCFMLNRRYQDAKPTNVFIVGPPGTGKTQLVKKFAEETGLPYWHVMGQQGITAEELLGRQHLVKMPDGSTKDVWVDGIIPKAVRAGGILHFDEANVTDPSVLMRLDELMDDKRTLSMEDLNGERIKAHPDLFIVFTTNPPNYSGVNPIPKAVLNRVTTFELDFPPANAEYEIIEKKLRQMGVSPAEFNHDKKGLTGKYADEIRDFMKIIRNLRKDRDLPFHPSIRNSIDFVNALRTGADFKTAFKRAVGNLYTGYGADPEYEAKMNEVLQSVNRL